MDNEASRASKVLGMFLLPFFFVGSSLAAGSSEALIAKLDCPDRVNAVAFSSDGQFLAAGYGWNDQGGVKIWRMVERTVVWTWVAKKTEKSSETVDKVAFSPDGRLFAAATSTGDVLVWKVGTWGEPRRIILKAGSPTALIFSPNSETVALSSNFAVFHCDLKTWNSRKLSSRVGPAQEFIIAGFSADRMKLAVCRYASVQWWDVATGQTVKSWELKWARLFLQPFLEPQLFGRRWWCGLQGQERRTVERIGRKTSGSTIGNQERAVYIGDLPLKPMDSTRRRKLGTGRRFESVEFPRFS
jgi:WD40 repeat protein